MTAAKQARPTEAAWKRHASIVLHAIDLYEELQAIVNAERFNRIKFDDDTAFADWVQSRARAAIARAEGT